MLELEIAECQHYKKLNLKKVDLKLCKDIIDEKNIRKFLKASGKQHLLDFTDSELKKLKECFYALDEDGSGQIEASELETPLIGLGFADTKEEVA